MELIELKERPLLCNGDMVMAILEGIKTHTRRTRSLEIINKNPNDYELKGYLLEKVRKDLVIIAQFNKLSTHELVNIPCLHYGKPGDLFWVRETWRQALSETHECYAYRADMIYRCGKPIPSNNYNSIGWKPSIHMRKEIARIWLECTSITIQRLQDISEADALAEGIKVLPYGTQEEFMQGLVNRTKPAYATFEQHESGLAFASAKASFKHLWESMNGKGSWDIKSQSITGGSWDKNDWVWNVGLKKIAI